MGFMRIMRGSGLRDIRFVRLRSVIVFVIGSFLLLLLLLSLQIFSLLWFFKSMGMKGFGLGEGWWCTCLGFRLPIYPFHVDVMKYLLCFI